MKTPIHPSCPKCSAPIPENAPQGLCPKCVLAGAATLLEPRESTRGKTPPPAIDELAPHFPDLEILKLLGAGGMGAVYMARQPQLDRFVALKILSHDLASDPAFVERFNREARMLGRLNHPNIVGIYDFGTAGPYCYLLMEYVDGLNLRQAMQAGRFTPTEALETVQHLCSALKFAHEEGILHRDIKPENILIDTKGRVKVADFGIAKLVGEDRPNDITLTLQGSVLGTPHYMAPEQIETPGDVDQRADIYSLGVVFYELLTGGLPIGRFALPSEKASMDARIDHIVMRTLEKDREARYQTAGEVRTQVEAITHSRGEAPKAAGGTPATPVSSPVSQPETARFATASAILTALGLLLAGVAVCAYFVFENLREWNLARGGPGLVPGAFFILGAISLVVVGVPAILGMILGSKAMSEIRRSGGVKTGLGSAIFATTAWPILFLFPLGTLLFRVPIPMPAGEGRSIAIGAFMVILVAVPSVLVAAWLLVRSLYRWAGGVERTDGTRFHPRLGMPLLMVMLVTMGGPLLLFWIAQKILPAGQDPHAEEVRRFMEAEENRVNALLEPDPSVTDAIDWHHGIPEVKIPLCVNPGLKVEFRLIRSLIHDAADENRLQTTELDEISYPVARGPSSVQGIPPYKTNLFIGTTAPRKDRAGLTAVCQWKLNHKFNIDMDFRDWQFATQLPAVLVISEVGVSKVVIATKETGNPETAEQLVLRVVVTEAFE